MAASEVPISPITASKPELTISPAAVNNEPVELDSTPTSAEKRRRGSRAMVLQEMSTEERQVQRTSLVVIDDLQRADEYHRKGRS